MLVIFLSISIHVVITFLTYGDITRFPILFRLGLLVILLCTWFYMMYISARIKFGLLHIASVMLWVAPILEFKEPVTGIVFLCLTASLFFLFLDITMGLVFRLHVEPIERSWCAYEEQPRRKVKKGRNSK